MNRQTLPINEIIVSNRQRLDYGDLDSLAKSLAENGLIQPIVINQDKALIAGGRRLEAARRNSWEFIDVVYRHTLSQDELHILELEENVQRLDETWQEKALHIQTIHALKQKLKAQDSESWGQRETGAMLGISVGHINYCLTIARKLAYELTLPEDKRPYWNCGNLSEAWRLWCRDGEDACLAELARRHKEAANLSGSVLGSVNAGASESGAEPTGIPFGETSVCSVDGVDPLKSERERYYSNLLNPPGTFEEYWAERQKLLVAQQSKTINLSRRLFHGDSIKFMLDNPGRFDHVITDIPYGIDMAMLNQQNEHGSMRDIDTVEAAHDVEYNYGLIADFFPAAYHCTKDSAFVITWADQMLWQYMYDHAVKAGFAVQRWPITWVKTSKCMNQCVAYNSTKNTEIAIVCRKKGATIAAQPGTSVIVTGRDNLCSDIGHPFAKPFEAWKFLIEMATLENQSILEPFAGRGSGVISMLRLNRMPFGVELEEPHYNALLENVKQLFYLKLDPTFTFV